MKLGLLHEVDTLKASLGEQLCYVSFEHKSLQELAAALYITQVLDEAEKAENTEVNFTSAFLVELIVLCPVFCVLCDRHADKCSFLATSTKHVPLRQRQDATTFFCPLVFLNKAYHWNKINVSIKHTYPINLYPRYLGIFNLIFHTCWLIM